MSYLTLESLETINDALCERHILMSELSRTGPTRSIRKAASDDLVKTAKAWEGAERLIIKMKSIHEEAWKKHPAGMSTFNEEAVDVNLENREKLIKELIIKMINDEGSI
jgi:hypothetical protein